MASENLHVHKPARLKNFYIFLLFIPSIVFVVVLVLYLSAIQKNQAASTYNSTEAIPTPEPEDKFTTTVLINDLAIKAVLADDPQERSRGLAIFPNIPEGRGMLFVFQQKSRPRFWMKDMSFAIDIIWINEGKIIQIDENVNPPETGTADEALKLFTPAEPINYVLEVNAGFSQRHGLSVGDSVNIF